jgi:flagellar hook-associated protein FlgK
MPIAAGKIKAMLDANNEVIPDARERLGELAGQIIQAVDSQHAKGIPDTGAFRVLLGQRAVSDVTAPLSRAETAFPVTAGDMYVTVTDSSGNRRTEKITIDPTIDSLDDLAARFDAVTGLSASVDGVRKTISFQSEAGYSFDFAGRTDNVPDLTAFSGTSQPQFTGIYSGSENDAWTVSFSGPGTIGVTPGLTATVRDQAGNIITTKFVGEGYEAGTPLEVHHGLSMRFTNGTVVAGDEASLNVVANSDTTGLLSALGVNSLFSGASAGIYAVRQDIVNSPQSLSGSLNGNPGDATNFARIAKLRDSRFAGLGSRTFTEEMADITADTGLAVQAAENQNSQLSSARINMEADRDAVSGVDINEEMLRMMEVERAYQAAARFITAVDGTLDDLLQMSR